MPKYQMATLIVETGAGVVGANSFGSIAEADDYHSIRANSDWSSATAPQKTAALVNASDYLNSQYRALEAPLTATQGLQWPTYSSYDSFQPWVPGMPVQIVGVPSALKAATNILALRALAGPLSAPAIRGIKSTTKKLEGVGELATVYDDVGPVDPYPAVTAMLAEIATPKVAGSISVRRLLR